MEVPADQLRKIATRERDRREALQQTAGGEDPARGVALPSVEAQEGADGSGKRSDAS